MIKKMTSIDILQKYRHNRDIFKIFLNNIQFNKYGLSKNSSQCIASYLLPEGVKKEIKWVTYEMKNKSIVKLIVNNNMYNSLKYILRQMPIRDIKIFLHKKHHIKNDCDSYNILNMSIIKNRFKIAKLLIKYGADINYAPGQFNVKIIDMNDIKSIKFIIENGFKDKSLFMNVCCGGTFDTFKYMYDKKFYEPKFSNFYLRLSCDNCNKKDSSDIIIFIIQKFKINLEIYGNRLITYACKYNNINGAIFIINNISNIDIPLVMKHACKYSRLKIVQHLFETCDIPRTINVFDLISTIKNNIVAKKIEKLFTENGFNYR